MNPATLDAILTILALMGVGVLVLLTERVVVHTSRAAEQREAAAAGVTVTPASGDGARHPGV